MYMNPRLFENIRINAQRFVKEGVAQYEKEFGKFEIDALKQKFLDNSLKLVLNIIDRVFNDEEISILPLKNLLLETLFELNFNSEGFLKIYDKINKEIILFIQSEPNYDANISRIFNAYFALISENIDDYSFYSGSAIVNILQSQQEYQYSETTSSFYPIEVSNKKIYTLFPKERYWEFFSKTPQENMYSPLRFNRVAVTGGFPQYQINLTYDDLLIYEGELYKLNLGVEAPSREVFNESEWVKYNPKRFDSSKSFKATYLSKIRSVFGKISDTGFDVNSIISDSFIPRYSSDAAPRSGPALDDFVHSFGGEGKRLLQTIYQLENVSNSLGGYEGSLIGGLEYISNFSEYLLSAAFGRDVSENFGKINGSPIFGKFNILFASKTSINKIPGLKFLDGFTKLKSFVHNQTVSFDSQPSPRVVYNPVYEKFSEGIPDSFSGLQPSSSYFTLPRVDLLLYSIESLYKKCNVIGDLIQAGVNTLDFNGKTPGYEGLGSIEVQLKALQNVFPPSRFFLESEKKSGVGPGLTGMIRYLLNNYSALSQGLIDPLLPGKSLEFLLPWIEKISNKLEEMLFAIEKTGIGVSTFIPNLSFKTFLYEDGLLLDFLKSRGFRDSEIEQLLNVSNLKQLITNFAPLSNSSDLKSFFKAYELTQLIYEMGGEEGIDAYLTFLYSSNSLDSLLNILDLSTKDKSKFTHLDLAKYPKLIGLLIGLTYAIDPNQLVKFDKILGANNLTLLESISFLFQQGETTLIKSQEDISLLRPMVEQVISGVYDKDAFASQSLTYDQANTNVPIALKQWTKQIGDNLGRVTSTDLIKHLYDRSVGLTPKELISILNTPDSPNIFGALIDGFSGGEFTSFLRYVNLTGLGFKLGTYKNSYQTNNFEVGKKAEASFFPELISETKGLIDSFSIFKTVFDSSLDYNFKYDNNLVKNLDPFIKAQNKSFELIPALIQEEGLGSSLEELNVIANDFSIAESPGIGNSRVPNRIPAFNSLTPEQADILLEKQQSLLDLTLINQQNLSLISKFIKFTQDNRLANTLQIKEEQSEKIRVNSKPKEFIAATPYEIEKNIELTSMGRSTLPKEYVVPKTYSVLESSPEIKSSGLGANYLGRETPIDALTESFDPVESCKKFGGTNCSELYSSSSDRCSAPTNKSLFPEEYTTVPGVSPTAVIIDRPLGTFAQYKPNKNLLSTTSFSNPPAYFDLLPQEALPGANGEPILNLSFSDPLIFESGGGDVSEYDNTEFGIVEFIKAKLEKNSEFGCAGFESPFYYQVCMNIMKCKRFNPPLQGRNFLDFCPKTLSGGRLK
jgi:hypothetical protein